MSETPPSDVPSSDVSADRGKKPLMGILGGIASGKSLVAGQLAALGARVVSMPTRGPMKCWSMTK